MQLSKMISNLEEFCPPSFAESWDNTGLLVGHKEADISRVMLCVDATSEVIEEAIQEDCDLILSHHPLLFHGIKNVNDSDFIGRRVLQLAENHIALYAMHTNFDVMGMADAAADAMHLLNREVLLVTFEDDISREGLGRVGQLPQHMTLQELAESIKDVFHIPHVSIYGDLDMPVISVGILPGAGKDEIDQAIKAGAEVMITGDITHHVGIDAVEKGIAVIDAGHYGVEKLFIPYMKDYFVREFPDIKVLKATEKEPFTIV